MISRCAGADILTKKTLLAYLSVNYADNTRTSSSKIMRASWSPGQTPPATVVRPTSTFTNEFSSEFTGTVVVNSVTSIDPTQLTTYRPKNSYTLLKSIPDANWAITSFDARSRIVCIEVTTGETINYITLTLPYILPTTAQKPQPVRRTFSGLAIPNRPELGSSD